METMGLRELNQNPSKAVARVRAGATIVVTDRGRPVMRMVPETAPESTLERMVAAGEVTPPAEQGMPELALDLLPDVGNLSDLLIEDRNRERDR
ncbi:type II toxin-antitoxin system Phd/YefM family antitoxin [Kitasatospora sp. NPDC101157]|uniref:type II toxin-antitoxin system Phd/YefM family antitoxin n=1 Tax=Kitasatospora sp. NPDC101157 TaxID=3364098 RepID=UPI00380F9D98